MTDRDREVLVSQLLAARAQIDATLTVLGVPFEDDDAAICAHPMESREVMTTMGGPEEWRCRACGFHSTTASQTEG